MNTRITAALAAIFTLFLFSNNLQAQQGMGVGNANPQEMLDVTGAIKIGTDINNSNAAPSGGAGTIRFRAGQFEGWDGTSWIPLGGGGGTSPFVLNGNLVQPDNTVVNLATDDFIFGSPSLDDNANTDNDGRFFFDKSKGAFRAGLVTGSQWNDANRGLYSFAAGNEVTASGEAAMALGQGASATGDNSFAWGSDVNASGANAVAIGNQTTASGNSSYASGLQSNASGILSVAIGFQANATEIGSFAVGSEVSSTAESAIAIGYRANASGVKSLAFGRNVDATGQQSIVFGHENTTSGRYSMGWGVDLTASGYNSMALGKETSALSSFEMVVGRANTLYTPGNTTGGWVGTDRLFTVGNGTGTSNRSNALTILKNGNTGIGTSAPSATLHVDGTMRYVDGNQAAGFVATSDANGNITWTDPTTISTAADADGDATNELQTLSQSGTDVTLSNGGGTISVADNDNDATNEYNTGVSLSGTQLQITDGGGTQTVDLTALVNDADWTVSGNDQYSAVSGRVGIGTTTPTSKLHVAGGGWFENNLTTEGDVRFENTNGTGSNNPLFRLDGFADKMYIVAEGGTNGPTNGTEIRLRTSGGGTAIDRMTIDNAGNVGIGTTAPAEKLHVNGSIQMEDGNEQAGYIPVSDANGKMTWTDPTTLATANDGDWTVNGNDQYSAVSGSVGIGTNTPTSKLHIQSGDLLINDPISNNSATRKISIAGARIGDQNPYAILEFVNRDADDSNTAYVGASIRSHNDGGADGGDMRLFTSSSERVRINGSGNVGVGITAPVAKLHVGSSATGDSYGIRLTQGSANSLIYHNADNDLIIRKAAQADQLVLDNDGNIGIGTDAPANKLHVEGAIRMVDGNQQAGYIPVSDANGMMIWTDPTTITTAADGDGDATNELQTLSQSGTNVTLSNGGGTISVADNDNDATNELQTLSIAGNDITLSNGGGTVTVPTQTELADADNDTKIQVEESADEDKIRFDVAGTEQFVMKQIGVYNESAIDVAGTSLYMGRNISTSVSGGYNIVIGNNAGTALEASAENVFVGSGAGRLQTTGEQNTFIGFRAGNANTTGKYNLFMGYRAGENITAGTYNLIMGWAAGMNRSLGAQNVLLGAQAGLNSGSGSRNVFIGFSAGIAETGDDRLYIENSGSSSPLIYGEFDNDIVGINGKLGVGTQTPFEKLDVEGRIKATNPGTAPSGSSIILGSPANDVGVTMNRGDGSGNVQQRWDMKITNDNAIRFRTGNTTDLFAFTNTGNLGIGTTGPSEKLHVEGAIRMVDGNQQAGYIPVSDANGTMTWTDPLNLSVSELSDADNDTKIQVEESSDEDRIRFDAGGTERMIIDSNGNVGIGTSSPVDKLHVLGGATLGRKASGANTENALNIEGKLEGNVNPYVAINFKNIDSNSGNTDYIGASIRSHNNGSSDDGDLRFYTTSDQTLSEAMRIDHLGIVSVNEQLGVGTQTPDSKLHVSSSTAGDATGIKLTQGIANSLIYHNSDNDLVIRKAAQTDQLVLDNDGNVGIGTSSPNSKFHVTTSGLNGFESYAARIENTSNWSNYSNGLRITAGQNAQTDNNRFISFRRPDGTEVGAVRQTSSSSVDFFTPSDQRLKTNIQETTKGLADLMQLQVKDYVYKDDPEKPQTGFIAQEVYEVFPNAVSVGGDDAKTDPWMMNYGNLTPLLVKAVQDLTKLVEEQQKEIEALKANR
ncbi:MAG: tail fiber domain-containing protein [Flavobacteriales bacterium]|nr:tail fiber domain-containing protein [Flavobacteriales bacterium]